MARVTVEDCLEKVDDRFELVALAAQRAKAIGSGSAPTIDRNGEKNTVIALREIAGDHVEIDTLREDVVLHQQTQRQMDEDVEDDALEGAEMIALEGEDTSDELQEAAPAEDAADAGEESYSFEDDNLNVLD